MTTADMTTPPEVELVRSFVNTVDHEDGTDALGSPTELRRWLVAHTGMAERSTVTRGDLELAQRLRSALRAELTAHDEGAVDGAARLELEAISAALPLRMVASDDGLAAGGSGATGGLGEIVAATVRSRLRASWPRLKICPAEDCRWAFYDTSRNRSRRWCSMEVCGNRNKVRAFRDRSRD